MKYSLELIAEKSGYKKEDYRYLGENREGKYSSVQIFPGEEKFCQEHTIYIFIQPESLSRLIQEENQQKFRETLPGTLPKESCIVCAASCEEELWKKSSAGEMIHRGYPLILFLEDSAEKLFFKFSSVFKTFSEQYAAFVQAAAQKISLKKAIGLFYDFLGNPAYMVDSSFKVIAIDLRTNMRELSASWKHLEDDGYLSYDLIENLTASRELDHIEAFQTAHLVTSHCFYVPFINYNLRKNGRLLGHLFVVGMLKEITPGDIELTEIYGEMILQAIGANLKFQNQRGRNYEYFIRDLFQGKLVDRGYIEKQMASLGFGKDMPMAVIACQPESQKEIYLERLQNCLERFRNSKPVFLDGCIVSLFHLHLDDTRESIREHLGKLGRDFGFICSVSEKFYGFSDVSLYYQQAKMALSVRLDVQTEEMGMSSLLPAKIYDSTVVFYSECALYQLLKSFASQQESALFFHKSIEKLLRYDMEKSAELTKTLLVYLEQERNIVHTADALYIHRNTLTYRIKKIEALTELNLDDPKLRVRIYISLLYYLKKQN